MVGQLQIAKKYKVSVLIYDPINPESVEMVGGTTGHN